MRRWATASDGIRMPLWPKDPEDVEDYTLDWSLRLVSGDWIASAVIADIHPDLQVISVNWEDSITSVWISGGTAGSEYDVTFHITTAAGRQHDRTFRLICENK